MCIRDRCEPCEPDAAEEPAHEADVQVTDACTGSASDESQIPANVAVERPWERVLVDIQQTLDKFDEYDRKKQELGQLIEAVARQLK